MPIESYTLGPGTLEFDDGAPFDVSLQVTACKIVPSESVTTTEAKKVLGGGELPARDSASYSYSLQGSFLQDLAAAGIVDWSWTNEGQTVDFTFIPSAAEARKWTGQVRVVPLQVGGDDIDTEPESEFEWKCITKPTPGPVI